jgi:hypothetical protein
MASSLRLLQDQDNAGLHPLHIAWPTLTRASCRARILLFPYRLKLDIGESDVLRHQQQILPTAVVGQVVMSRKRG